MSLSGELADKNENFCENVLTIGQINNTINVQSRMKQLNKR